LQAYGNDALGGLLLYGAHLRNITSTLKCRQLL
jgi:hypothetical protein